MNYYLAPSLVTLRGEINALWPNRDKASDGWIGDPAHASRISDHNPDEKGCVHAIDVDIDGIKVRQLLKEVVGDERVWYVIFNRRIYSRTYDWTPRVYNGRNPHTTHVHVSIRYSHDAETNSGVWFDPVKHRTKGGRLPVIDTTNVQRQHDEGGTRAHPGVKRIQRQLNRRYQAGLTVDGYFGDNTRDAYRQHEVELGIRHPNSRPHVASLRHLARGRFRVLK